MQLAVRVQLAQFPGTRFSGWGKDEVVGYSLENFDTSQRGRRYHQVLDMDFFVMLWERSASTSFMSGVSVGRFQDAATILFPSMPYRT